MYYIPNDLYRKLIKHMGYNNLEPYDGIIIDNETHVYDAYMNNVHHRAFYTACLSPFDGVPLYLICWYGLIDSKTSYIFYSLV